MDMPNQGGIQDTLASYGGIEGLQPQYNMDGVDEQQHSYDLDGVNGNDLKRMSGDSVLRSGILLTASGNDILRSHHDVDAAEQGQAGDQGPVVYSHEWEHAIYEGRKVPEDHRKHVQLHGFGGTPGHPWLITGATGTDDRAQQFHWNSRRHRKGRSPAHKMHPPHTAFRPLAWMDPTPFLTSPKKFISWLSPILTMLGSTLFAINNASQASKHVQPWSMEPYRGHHLYDWIAATLAFAGLWVVLPGQYLKWVETLNTDYDMRVHNWEQEGKKRHKPRLRFVGFRPRQLSYWGVLLRVLGAAVFVVAATDNWLNQTCHVYMKKIVEDWIIYFPYVLAPSLFLVGSILLIWENSHSFYKGFIPLSSKEACSLGFWANALGFWGSLGLLVGGICQWNLMKIMMRSGVKGVQLYRGLAYFAFGSLLLDTSQALILMELSNPDTTN